MTPSLRRFYAFGPFTLDTVAPLLWRDGEPVNLTPKSLETLSVLVQRAGQLVKREELIEAVWPDTVVEENNLSVNISALRKALLQGEAGEKYIETVSRRGYRFTAPVRDVVDHSVGFEFNGDPPSMMLVKEANKAGPETRLIVEQIASALLTRLTVDERERLAKLLEAEGQACE